MDKKCREVFTEFPLYDNYSDLELLDALEPVAQIDIDDYDGLSRLRAQEVLWLVKIARLGL